MVKGLGDPVLDSEADQDGGRGVRVACQVCKVGLLVCMISPV